MFIFVDFVDGIKEFINKNGEFIVNIVLIENCVLVVGCVYVLVIEKIYVGGYLVWIGDLFLGV